ncbi:MAG: GDP-mannose 4,6-dehydratase [Actinobacteria bacterium]|nr:GDP-mannose 4,6-dehydratase [Actinomycetota bacterium]
MKRQPPSGPPTGERRALIVGIGGQDGSYLAELLLARGYHVAGLVRHSSAEVPERVAHLRDRLTLIRGDLLDQLSLSSAIERARPHEIYNFAGSSFIPESWQQPALTAESTAMGVVRLLEAIRLVDPSIRFYQASSSEMFGRPEDAPQSERTRFNPRNPYAVSKVFGHMMVERYREGFGLFAVSGILYNHESPRRGLEFVTRKITSAAAHIALGRADSLSLGNIAARRDWGFAGDYVHAMWLMLQQPEPCDYVVASGELHTVEDVLDVAFEQVGLEWQPYVRADEALFRPLDEALLVGDSSRVRAELGWKPTVSFEGLVRLMVDADLARLDTSQPVTPEVDWPAGSPLLARQAAG